jgi:hypothetical protein
MTHGLLAAFTPVVYPCLSQIAKKHVQPHTRLLQRVAVICPWLVDHPRIGRLSALDEDCSVTMSNNPTPWVGADRMDPTSSDRVLIPTTWLQGAAASKPFNQFWTNHGELPELS